MKNSSKISKWHSYDGWLKLDRQVKSGEKANYKVDGTPKFHINQTKKREGYRTELGVDYAHASYIERCKALNPPYRKETLRRNYKRLIHAADEFDESDYELDYYMQDYIDGIGDR